MRRINSKRFLITEFYTESDLFMELKTKIFGFIGDGGIHYKWQPYFYLKIENDFFITQITPRKNTKNIPRAPNITRRSSSLMGIFNTSRTPSMTRTMAAKIILDVTAIFFKILLCVSFIIDLISLASMLMFSTSLNKVFSQREHVTACP